MNKNIIIVILILVMLGGAYWVFREDLEYRNKIKNIEKTRDSLEMSLAKLHYEYEMLENRKQKIKYVSAETNKKLKSQENETNAIPGIVATYSNSMLDSILTNYRFKPRAKSRDSDRP